MTLVLAAAAALLLFGSYLVLRALLEADFGNAGPRWRAEARPRDARDERRAA